MLYMRFVNVIDIDDNHHHRQREDHHRLATTTDIVFISEWMKELKHYIQYIVCSSSASPLFHQILSVRKLRDTYSNFSSLCILLHDNNEEKTRLRYGMVFIWEYGKTAVENVTFRIELLDSRSGWVEMKTKSWFSFLFHRRYLKYSIRNISTLLIFIFSANASLGKNSMAKQVRFMFPLSFSPSFFFWSHPFGMVVYSFSMIFFGANNHKNFKNTISGLNSENPVI